MYAIQDGLAMANLAILEIRGREPAGVHGVPVPNRRIRQNDAASWRQDVHHRTSLTGTGSFSAYMSLNFLTVKEVKTANLHKVTSSTDPTDIVVPRT